MQVSIDLEERELLREFIRAAVYFGHRGIPWFHYAPGGDMTRHAYRILRKLRSKYGCRGVRE